MLRARILGFIGWLVIAIWGRTIRLTFIGKDIPDRFAAENQNIIYAFWHGRQFLLVLGHRGTGIILPSSESRDGEIQTRIMTRFGYGIVRGSSKRKGEKALLGLVDGLRKGKNIGLAVDGPRGPLHEAKQGAAYLAGKLNKPIIPVATSAKRYWIFEKIWDKYLLPKPFTQGIILYGDPIIVNGISTEELEEKRKELETALSALMVRADNHFNI